MELARRLYDAGIVVKNMTHLEAYDYDMEKFFAENVDGIKKDWAYQVVLSFGSDCPTTNEYNKFDHFASTMGLLPSAKKLRKSPSLQKSWEIAYHWAYEYEQSKLETVIAVKEKKNSQLEQELRVMKAKIKQYEDKIAAFQSNKDHELLAKDQEIAKLKESISKHKLKINQLKRKYSYKAFKKNEPPELEREDFSRETN